MNSSLAPLFVSFIEKNDDIFNIFNTIYLENSEILLNTHTHTRV